MCLQCMTLSHTVLDEALPGVALHRARQTNGTWPAYHYGFIFCNDPFLIFEGPFLKDPLAGLTEEEIDRMDDMPESFYLFIAQAKKLGECLNQLDFDISVRLMAAMTKAGYAPDIHGNASYWLMHHIASKIESAPKPLAASEGDEHERP